MSPSYTKVFVLSMGCRTWQKFGIRGCLADSRDRAAVEAARAGSGLQLECAARVNAGAQAERLFHAGFEPHVVVFQQTAVGPGARKCVIRRSEMSESAFQAFQHLDEHGTQVVAPPGEIAQQREPQAGLAPQ